MRQATKVRFLLSFGATGLSMIANCARAQQSDVFQTFVVAAPQIASTSSVTGRAASLLRARESRRRKVLAKATASARTEVTATLFPGASGVLATSSGNIGPNEVTTNFDTVQDATGHPTNTGFFEVEQAGRGVEFGSGILNMLGADPGLRFFSSPEHNAFSAGAGIYVFQNEFGRSRLVPMLDSLWRIGKGQSLTTGAGADGTFATSYGLNTGSWQATLQAVDSSESRSAERSIGVRKSLSPASSFYARSTFDSATGGRLESYGLIKRVGAPTLSFDDYRYSDSSTLVSQARVGMMLPLRRQSLSLQFLDEKIEPEAGNSEEPGQTETLNCQLYSRVDSSESVWQSVSFSSGATGPGRPAFDLLVGVDKVLNSKWRVSTSLERGFGTNELSAKGFVEYAISPGLRLRLLYGPKTVNIDPGLDRTGFGLQVIRSFDSAYVPMGDISGQITIDGQPCHLPLQVAIDEDQTATCDKNGRFHFKHVLLGEHAVTLVADNLPADLSSDEACDTVTTTERHQSTCNFHLHRVSQILGTVDEVPDQFGHEDPSARDAVIVRDNLQDVCSTDSDGSFCLANLRTGTYTVSIDERSIPADYEVKEPKSVDVTVVAGQTPPLIHFTIMPIPHPVVFATDLNSNQSHVNAAPTPPRQ